MKNPKNPIIEQALKILESEVREGEPITNPDPLKDILRLKYGKLKTEVIGGVLLDQSHRIIEITIFEHGIENRAHCYTKKIVARLLKKNASALILFHNHPSDSPEFSKQDIDFHKKIKAGLEFIEIRLLDHLLITKAAVYSATEKGVF